MCPCRDRREFLKQTAGAASVVAALGNRDLIETVGATQQDEAADSGGSDGAAGLSTDEVFPQSVASGGPRKDGVILWTRVSQRALETAPDADLRVTVATGPDFETVVHDGVVDHDDVAGNDNCVRCDLAGELRANEQYFYRFDYGGVSSNVGRCRTLPGPDADVEEVTFAVVNCNHYQNGYFNAYGYAAEHAADFMLHLGDFIYESTGGVFTSDKVIEPNADGYYGDRSSPVRSLPDEYKSEFQGVPEELTNGNGDRHEKLAWHAEDYRALYKSYKSDEDTKRALERHTVIYTWDDHEVADDRYWDYDASGPDSNGVGGAFVSSERYANAIQAWLEHIPARVEADRDKIQAVADGEEIHEYTSYGRRVPATLHNVFDLYDHFEFGDLLELFVTDERFYREKPPSGLGPRQTFEPLQQERSDDGVTRERIREQMAENCDTANNKKRASRPDCDVAGGIDEDRLDERVANEQGFANALEEVMNRTRDGTDDATGLDFLEDDSKHEGADHYEFPSEQDGDGNDPHHADRTMLGGQQKRWMEDRLRDSDTTWTLWMNEVLASPMTISEPGNLLAREFGGLGFLPGPDDHPDAVEVYHDAWDGYVSEREEILEAASEGTNNFVTLTGDMHASLASRLHDDYGGGDAAGVEFMVPAMTSETPYEQMSEGDGGLGIPKKPPVLTSDDSVDRLQKALTMMNTHVKGVDFRTTGYAVVTVTEDRLDYKTFDVVRSLESGDLDGRTPAMHRRVPNDDNLWWEQARIDETQATAAATPSDRRVSVGETVSFDASDSVTDFGSTRGSVTRQYEWDFDDGTTESGGEQVQHSFNAPGAYEVELTFDARLAGRAAGRSDSDTATVLVVVTGDNEPPVAEIGVSNYDGPDDGIVVGDTVHLSASPSEDPDGYFANEVERIEWAFGDGTTESGEPSTRGTPGVTGVTHTYEAPGNYTVELTLVDRDGARDTATTTVTVERDDLVADFDYESLDGDGDTILVGQAVAFDAETDGNDGATYEWAFGDGTTATGPSVEHFFESGGNFEVELTVTGPDGETARRARRVSVEETDPGEVPGEAEFTGQVGPGEVWTGTYTVEERSSALELRMEGPPGSDFDLLVSRDGSTPERITEYDYVSQTTLPAETVRIDDRFQPDEEVGIGVFAAFGTGRFAVSVTEVTPEEDRKDGKDEETPAVPEDGEEDDGGWFDDLIDDAFGGWTDADETGSESDTTDDGADDGDDSGGWFDDGDGIIPGEGNDPFEWFDDGDDEDSGDDDDDSWLGGSDDDDGDDGDDGWFDWGDDDDPSGGSGDDSGDSSGSSSGGDDGDSSSGGDDGGDRGRDDLDDGGSSDWNPTGGWENNFDQTGSYGGTSSSDDDDDDDGGNSSSSSGGGGLIDTVTDTVTDTVDTIGDTFGL